MIHSKPVANKLVKSWHLKHRDLAEELTQEEEDEALQEDLEEVTQEAGAEEEGSTPKTPELDSKLVVWR